MPLAMPGTVLGLRPGFGLPIVPCMKQLLLCMVLLLAFAAQGAALGPHELLVVANAESPDSVRIAQTYLHLRGIPEQNYVEVSIPIPETGVPRSFSHKAFTRRIWEPVNRVIAQRGLEDQILAWAYSVDFPVAINTQPRVSLQGITFMRNVLPDASGINRGSYESPLFAGPDSLKGDAFGSQSFDLYAEWLREDMPLPSMMLGVTGERGNTVDEILECLRRGVRADYTAPVGTVYFVYTDDIRSRCREWQYVPTGTELQAMGIRFQRATRLPQDKPDVIGLQIGEADVQTDRNFYLPGAMAEHLTSLAGVFDSPQQTKVSAWIRSGATASAGTVTEPFSIWSKFPHARFYVHYAYGCTLIESFYQSIRCPLQILLVGEPLAAPWAGTTRLKIEGIEPGEVSGYITATASCDDRHRYGKYTFLLNGKVVHRGERLALDTRNLRNGLHTLRVVAYKLGLVRSQVYSERTFTVLNN